MELEPYTYEQFSEITEVLLSHHRVPEEVGSVIANAVWNKSQDIRDSVEFAKLQDQKGGGFGGFTYCRSRMCLSNSKTAS